MLGFYALQKMQPWALLDCKSPLDPLRDPKGGLRECCPATFGAAYYLFVARNPLGTNEVAAWLQYQGECGVQKVAHGRCLCACEAEDDVSIVWNDVKSQLKCQNHRAESNIGVASKHETLTDPCF